MNPNEYFGSHAGAVWKALKGNERTLTQLQKITGLTLKEVSMGLGWLAKEGKIAIKSSEDSLHVRFQLTE